MYTIQFKENPAEAKVSTKSFEKLSVARKEGKRYFPNVTLKNKKGVVLPL